MISNLKFLFATLLIVLCFEQCHTATNADKPAVADTVVPVVVKPVVKPHHILIRSTKQPSMVEFDSIVFKLNNSIGLSKKDMGLLGITDTVYNAVAFQNYPDTLLASSEKTTQINDSILCSFIAGPDANAVCSYSFLVTLNTKSKKPAVMIYLHPDCDVDYSQDSYNTYEHNLTGNAVSVIKTIVYQKKNRTSDDEDENIDHKETHEADYLIDSNGEIEIKGEN